MYYTEVMLESGPVLRPCNLEVWERGYCSVLFQETLGTMPSNYPTLKFDYRDRGVFYEFINKRVLLNRAMDYLEFGVAAGESIRAWSALNSDPGSRFIGFDCFEGLPEDWKAGNKAKGEFSTGGEPPAIDDPRVSFVKGLFQKSLRPFLAGYVPQNRLVVHIDVDLYSSTLFVLTQLDPFMPKGTIIVFDEFIGVDEFPAFHHYTKAYGRTWRIVASRADHLKLAVVLRNDSPSASVERVQ
jgi:O-methyltransferase